MEQEESNAFERELLKVPAVLDMLEDSGRQLINALFYKKAFLYVSMHSGLVFRTQWYESGETVFCVI